MLRAMSLRTVVISAVALAVLAGCSKPSRTDDLTYEVIAPKAFVGSTFVLGDQSAVLEAFSGEGHGVITVPRKGPLVGASAALRVPTPCGVKSVSLAITPETETHGRESLDTVRIHPKPEDLPKTVTVYVDGAPKALKIGDASVALTSAGPKGGMKGELADAECRKDAAVTVDAVNVGTLPALPPPVRTGSATVVAILARKDVCYAFTQYHYGSRAGQDESSFLANPGVHALPTGLDYFLEVPPMSVRATPGEDKTLTALDTTTCPPRAKDAKADGK